MSDDPWWSRLLAPAFAFISGCFASLILVGVILEDYAPFWKRSFGGRAAEDMSEDGIEQIRAELRRLKATESVVGPVEAIYSRERGNGNAVLSSSSRGRDLDWFGSAAVILERLSGLPDGGGPEAIRSEFAS